MQRYSWLGPSQQAGSEARLTARALKQSRGSGQRRKHSSEKLSAPALTPFKRCDGRATEGPDCHTEPLYSTSGFTFFSKRTGSHDLYRRRLPRSHRAKSAAPPARTTHAQGISETQKCVSKQGGFQSLAREIGRPQQRATESNPLCKTRGRLQNARPVAHTEAVLGGMILLEPGSIRRPSIIPQLSSATVDPKTAGSPLPAT